MANKIIKFTVVQKTSPVNSILPAKDAALFDDMIDKWSIRRLGAKNHTQNAVKRDIANVKDMLSYIGTAPWFWTEDDFDAWCHHIGVERGLVAGTQRNYQSAIRSFFKYIVDNLKFKNDVLRNYGIDLKQICHSENCIPHINENEKSKPRPAFTHEQIDIFFGAIDLGIKEAAAFNSKDVRPLQRDKVLFYLLYIGGLRISEALGLNVTSFERNSQFPEFGEYGYINVYYGKGSNGSGKKHRKVPVTHPALPQLLDWYVKTIYPELMVNADANETALFLSERGNRMARSTAEARFHHALDLADLEGRGFTPHSMRHSSVTHESLRLSLEANRLKHGHVYAATTQGYMHIPDDMVRKETNDVISKQLDQFKNKPTDGESK